MSDFLTLLPQGGWPRVMVDALWQSTLVAATGIVAARFLLRQPSARAWVLLLAISACAIVPLVSLAARSTGWTLLTQTRARVSEPISTAEDGFAPPAATENVAARNQADPEIETATTAAVAAPVSTHLQVDWLEVAEFSWLVTSLFLLARLTFSLLTVRRMLRLASPCKVPDLLKHLAIAAKQLNLRQPPRLLVSDEVAMPMVFALTQPAVLIPAEVRTAHDNTNWSAIFAHELAHIARHDGWSRLWTQVIVAALPVSPLVWLARREFFNSCEEACDDAAVAVGNNPIDLADTLTSWLESKPHRAGLVAIGMSATKARTLRLLALRTTPFAEISQHFRWLTVATALFLTCCTATLQTSVSAEQNSPREPVATARVNAQEGAAQPAGNSKIAGTCVDEKGEPIPGAQMKLFEVDHINHTQRLLVEMEADDKGHYVFSIGNSPQGRPKGVYLTVIAQSAGKATGSHSIYTEEQGGETNITLPPAGKLNGRVVDIEGRPVAGAIVTSNGSGLIDPVPGICAAASDADGRYEIVDLRQWDLADQKPQPAVNGMVTMYGPSMGEVRHADYARESFSYSKVPNTVDVTMRRAAIVNGQVLLAVTNQAATGARVRIWSDNVRDDYWTRALVDELGEFRFSSLPPGKYRVSVELDGYPNLFRPDVELTSGPNRVALAIEKGGVINGRVVDIATEKPVVLAAGETMQISESTAPNNGRGGRTHYAGMNYADLKLDGTFTLRVPSGRSYLGMYYGPNWQGVNTDRLLRDGIEVPEGKTVDLEIRVRELVNGKPLPQPLPQQQVTQDAEKEAAAAINRLGGWVEEGSVDGENYVVAVNMGFYDDERMGRQTNLNMSDESLQYMRKFPKLKRLLLVGTQATDVGLANLRGLESLERITISGQTVRDATAATDAGAAHLATLPNLVSLGISNGQLTDESLRHFSRMPKLTGLGLQGNHFTNKGLEYLKDMTQLKSLSLGLGNNEITDDGLRHLARLTNLESLDLQRSQITDAGLVYLHGLKKLRSLTTNGTAVTKPAFEELRKTLPELQSSRF